MKATYELGRKLRYAEAGRPYNNHVRIMLDSVEQKMCTRAEAGEAGWVERWTDPPHINGKETARGVVEILLSDDYQGPLDDRECF